MVTGKGEVKGRSTVFVGLSFDNLRKFLAEPLDTYILVSGKEMGLPHDILLFSGATEEHMARAITGGMLPSGMGKPQ